VAKAHGVPFIGQGGIVTARDALEFIIAGATTVGVGTALSYDPLACRKLNAAPVEHLERHKVARLGNLVGSLAPARAWSGLAPSCAGKKRGREPGCG
jgi:dihydroorotate dehydrogenase (NAD+) catalytic subunit